MGAVILSAIPGLITLAVESLNSWIKGKQNNQIGNAITIMRRSSFEIKNELRQYRDDFVMCGKYTAVSLNDVIKTVNALHQKNTRLERLVIDHKFGKVSDVMATINYNFELQLFMEQAQEEHIAQFRQMKQAGKDLLDSIAILNQQRLPRGLFSDDRLRQILSEVEIMVKKQYPDYELAATHISHYCDMKMVTFAVDQQTHSLIVVFPAFIKDYKQPPLALFEIESVPVPIWDKNKLADSFSQVVIEKRYIAAGKDYYIQLHMTELAMCKNIQYIYYCEELFVVKHKSKHSCASAIFYNLGSSVVTENCKFHYMYNATIPPVILDGGKEVLLANFYGQRLLKCASQNGGLAKPIPEHTYVVIQREFLCNCQLDLKQVSVLRRLNACSGSKPQNLVMKFIVKLAFWEMLKKRHAQLSEKVQRKVDFVEQTF